MHNHGPSCLKGPTLRHGGWPLLACPGPCSLPPKSFFSETATEEAPIRLELVNQIRRQLAEGTYDTPERWEMALERLGRALGLDE